MTEIRFVESICCALKISAEVVALINNNNKMYKWASTRQNLSSGCPKKIDSNSSAKLQYRD